eukprot:gnl/TRDRNA2_/TRDRNA2_144162_c0_seq2.p1 gnl/TRDRNA2_/TRDRNA2_144162_c0~~gnl/TRDRNA2_/TRDRNA2_144162_c0_seq2.p1  ORF type:complete len:135 (+),score=8.26 gnl/TRDRNA2_/TRDRNA2_144162_c0_seq2:531-935(+)
MHTAVHRRHLATRRSSKSTFASRCTMHILAVWPSRCIDSSWHQDMEAKPNDGRRRVDLCIRSLRYREGLCSSLFEARDLRPLHQMTAMIPSPHQAMSRWPPSAELQNSGLVEEQHADKLMHTHDIRDIDHMGAI